MTRLASPWAAKHEIPSDEVYQAALYHLLLRMVRMAKLLFAVVGILAATAVVLEIQLQHRNVTIDKVHRAADVARASSLRSQAASEKTSRDLEAALREVRSAPGVDIAKVNDAVDHRIPEIDDKLQQLINAVCDANPQLHCSP